MQAFQLLKNHNIQNCSERLGSLTATSKFKLGDKFTNRSFQVNKKMGILNKLYCRSSDNHACMKIKFH